MKVLLVEDDSWLGELYVDQLTKVSSEARWCENGYDAIEILDAWKPDVIVLDLFLPWVNGLELLHEMASYVDLNNIPVVVCSSVVGKDVSEDVLTHYGVKAVLDKTTIKPRDLVNVVRSVYEKLSS